MKDNIYYNGEHKSKEELRENMFSLIDVTAIIEEEIANIPFDVDQQTAIRLTFSHIIVSEEIEIISRIVDEDPNSSDFAGNEAEMPQDTTSDTETILACARRGLYSPAVTYCSELANMNYSLWGMMTAREGYNHDAADLLLMKAEGYTYLANNLPSGQGPSFHEGLLLK